MEACWGRVLGYWPDSGNAEPWERSGHADVACRWCSLAHALLATAGQRFILAVAKIFSMQEKPWLLFLIMNIHLICNPTKATGTVKCAFPKDKTCIYLWNVHLFGKCLTCSVDKTKINCLVFTTFTQECLLRESECVRVGSPGYDSFYLFIYLFILFIQEGCIIVLRYSTPLVKPCYCRPKSPNQKSIQHQTFFDNVDNHFISNPWGILCSFASFELFFRSHIWYLTLCSETVQVLVDLLKMFTLAYCANHSGSLLEMPDTRCVMEVSLLYLYVSGVLVCWCFFADDSLS